MTVAYDGVIIGGTIQARRVAANAARQGARIALVEPPGEVDCQIRRQLMVQILAQASQRRQQSFFPEDPPVLTGRDWSDLRQRGTAAMDVAYPQLALDALAIGGVDVVLEAGQLSPKPQLAVTTATRRLRGRGYWLSPATEVRVPAIPGLAEAPILTPETVMDLAALPEEIVILGRSPDAISLAQSLAILGVGTTLMTRGSRLLPTEDQDISAFVERLLVATGVTLRLESQLEAIHDYGSQMTLHLTGKEVVKTPYMLVATARQPKLDELNLNRIHVQTTKAGIAVDDQLKTTRHRCFAFGPCLGGYWADHTDDLDGQIALQNALYLPWRKLQQFNRVASLATIPELARFGMTARQARTYYGDAARVIQIPYQQIAKFHLDDRMTGFCRCILLQDGSILGAQLVGPNARELAQYLAWLKQHRISMQSVFQSSHLPFTYSELVRRLAEAWQFRRWRPGHWRRDWAENWFNWRRSR